MASANESQGLKIAVAIFVSLTVILAVTAYFLYTEYDKQRSLAADARQEASEKSQAASQAQSAFNDLRARAGYREIKDATALKNQIEQDQQALLETVNNAVADATNMINQARQAGVPQETLQPYIDNVAQIQQRLNNETMQDPTFLGTMKALTDIVVNQSLLSTALARNNIDVRQQLERVNRVNQNELETQMAAVDQTNAELRKEHQEYEESSDEMQSRIGDLQQRLAEREARIADLTSQLRDTEAEFNTELARLRAKRDELQTELAKDETVLDVADGYITAVDYRNMTVHVNISRGMGVRPQMIFSVFDENAPGLPTDEPKARIMITEVRDNHSVAKIEEMFEKRNPIRYGDQVYSASWSPSDPKEFALIGKIDMNRDGRDDRADLVRLIQAAGGEVVYDVPPPGIPPAIRGGEMNADITWYVVDEREPILSPGNRQEVDELTAAEEQFHQERTQAISNARRLGIQPIRVERLLASLGYSFGMEIPGRVEARDQQAIDQLLNPGGRRAPLPGSDGAGESEATEPSGGYGGFN